MEFQAPRGTNDVLPDDQKYWRYVEDTASQVAESFGYRRIDTPVFEDTNLFVRGIDPNYPGNGVFFDRPSEALIEDLDNLIGGKLFS